MQFLRATKQRYIAVSGILLAIILLAAGWWFFIYDTPKAAFSAMLHQSLAVTSVSRETTSISDTARIDQKVAYRTGANPLAVSTTEIAEEDNTITIQTAGTFDADYIRYTSIKPVAKKNTAQHNYSNVLNIWAKDSHANQSTSNGRQLLPDAALRLSGYFGVPLLNIPSSQRGKLLQEANKDSVYQVDYKSVQKTTINGRAAYVYSVQIPAVPYVTYIKAVAAAAGFKQLAHTQPESYRQQAATKLQIAVDRRNHRLLQITYPTVNGYKEVYSGYNQSVSFTPPKTTVTPTQLQQRLQND